MPEAKSWTEDKCTCGHGVSKHANGDGRCDACDDDIHWAAGSGAGRTAGSPCPRFQWDGQPRRRTW